MIRIKGGGEPVARGKAPVKKPRRGVEATSTPSRASGKRGPGRPRGEPTTVIGASVPTSWLPRLEAARAAAGDKSTSETIRRLLEKGLK